MSFNLWKVDQIIKQTFTQNSGVFEKYEIKDIFYKLAKIIAYSINH